jgi:FixJ family two-component response regulator
VDRVLKTFKTQAEAITWAKGEGHAPHVARVRHVDDKKVGKLTSRQRQIMEMVLAGHPSKNIAVDHGISQRTVESHRTSIMKKVGTRSLPALARLALAGASCPADKTLVRT